MLNIKPFIGLIGKAGCGKDTVANYLQTNYGITRVAFADELKRKAMDDFGLTYEQVHGEEKEKLIPKYMKSARQILQIMGTEWYRTIYQNYWVDALYNVLKSSAVRTRKGLVISDVRFPNEVDFVKGQTGIIIRIIRPDQSYIKTSNHISEVAVDDIKADFVLMNDGTLESLFVRINNLVKFIQSKEGQLQLTNRINGELV